MGKRAGEKPTPGERVAQWLTNLKTVLALYLMLGGAAIYGNADAIKSAIYTEEVSHPESSGPIETSQPPEINLSCPEIDTTKILQMIKKRCSLSNHEEEYHQ